MSERQGFDEVTNVLLEHSFRYFGPTSNITRQINENKDWNLTILPEHNSLINLVDNNLRENNDAYLSFIYIMDYYIFDSFHTRLSHEIKNPTKIIDPSQLKFSEEELRKVMGNIGYLLLKEPTLLESEKYDYLALYFQIKKLWSVIITRRYLEEQVFTLEEIKNKIKKSFAIPQLMKLDKAKATIENFLISFDDIYKDKESIEKHIADFFKDYLNRYFSYIKLGIAPFIKDFCSIINSKFTSIDLLKENRATLNPTDPFHQLLINYLAEDSNNLQTESEMEKFITLINNKLNELFPPIQVNNLNDHQDDDLLDSIFDTSDMLAETDDMPVQLTDMPVQLSDMLVQTIDMLAETTDMPVEMTEMSAETIHTPVQSSEAPVQPNDMPMEANYVPVETIEMLVETTDTETSDMPIIERTNKKTTKDNRIDLKKPKKTQQIVNNHPNIELRPNGKIKYNGKMVTIYN